jgi:hypothetical protein
VLRRLVTQKGAFAWLPDYGVSFAAKKPASVAWLTQLHPDIMAQLKQEPEVSDVELSLSQDARGYLIVSAKVQTNAGAVLQVQAAAADGRVVIP